MDQLILTGAGGGIGFYLERALVSGFDLYSVTSSGRKLLGNTITCNLVTDDLENAFAGLQPKYLVHAAATFKYNQDIIIIKKIIDYCKKHNVFLVYFSSWVVLSKRGFKDGYTKSKIEAERLIKESGLKYCIIRPSTVIGKNLLWSKPFVGRLSQIIPSGISVNLIHARDVADIVGELIRRRMEGTFDTGGFDYDFRKYAEIVFKHSQYLNPTVPNLRPYVPRLVAKPVTLLLGNLNSSLSSLAKPFDYKYKETLVLLGFTPRPIEYFEEEIAISTPTREALPELINTYGMENIMFVGRKHSFQLQGVKSVRKKVISTQNLKEIEILNDAEVRVGAGVSLQQLTDYLDTKGFTIETLPEFMDLSIGACLKTPVHGSSNTYSSIADLVNSVTVYDKGKIQTLYKGTAEFNNIMFDPNELVCFIEATISIIPQRYLEKQIELVNDDMVYSLEMYDFFRNNLSAVVEWYPNTKRVLRWKINVTQTKKEDRPLMLFRFVESLAVLQFRFAKKIYIGKNHNVLGYWKKMNPIFRYSLFDSIGLQSDVEFALSPENYLEVIKTLKLSKVYAIGFRYAPAEKCFPNSWCYGKEVLFVEIIFLKDQREPMHQLMQKFALKEHSGKYVI